MHKHGSLTAFELWNFTVEATLDVYVRIKLLR
jgi:hypothetical protein